MNLDNLNILTFNDLWEHNGFLFQKSEISILKKKAVSPENRPIFYILVAYLFLNYNIFCVLHNIR